MIDLSDINTSIGDGRIIHHRPRDMETGDHSRKGGVTAVWVRYPTTNSIVAGLAFCHPKLDVYCKKTGVEHAVSVLRAYLSSLNEPEALQPQPSPEPGELYSDNLIVRHYSSIVEELRLVPLLVHNYSALAQAVRGGTVYDLSNVFVTQFLREAIDARLEDRRTRHLLKHSSEDALTIEVDESMDAVDVIEADD